MDTNEVIKKFYESVSDMMEKPITDETTLKGDLNISSGGYYMILAEMEELGADEVTYAMLRKCETMGDAARLLLSQLED